MKSLNHPRTNLMRSFYGAGILALAVLSWESASAIVINNDSISSDWRYVAGNGTANPTPNTNANFVGLGYDWSGVGGNGWGTYGPGRMHNISLLAPISGFNANHNSGAAGEVYYFFDTPTTTRQSATVASKANPIDDVSITTFTQAFSAADNISVLRILDISSSNYVGQSAFLIGTGSSSMSAGQGTQQISTAHVLNANAGTSSSMQSTRYSDDPTATFVMWENGDSGSPLLIAYKGQLTAAGAAWGAYGVASTLLAKPGSFDPVTPTNSILGEEGYALRFTIYDIPTDTANTANVWTGGAGTGDFNDGNNWSSGAKPVGLPIVLDSSASGGQRVLDLAGNQSVRGILFRENANLTGGFTFSAGNTLGVGTSGIRNEDSNTQTLHTDISLTGGQNWEAVGGNMVFNGNISNNGNLLVVQGAQTTTMNGILSGTGGLAKDEGGTLVLAGLNVYDGTTFIHNGTLRIGINDALPTNTVVRFDVDNPAVLDINGMSQTVGSIVSVYNGGGTVDLGGGALITGGSNESNAFAGIFVGGGSVTKVGLGTWTLTGDSGSYIGSITVDDGELKIANTGGSATGLGALTVNGGGTLSGIGTTASQVIVNAGARLMPGDSGVGNLNIEGGMVWNGEGGVTITMHEPGSSTSLNLGSSALTKGTFGNYNFTFLNGGGMASGLYTLMNFGSTNFQAGDFGYTNTGGFQGDFLLNSGSLQFQINNVTGTSAVGGWKNFSTVTATYADTANWINGVVNNRFVANINTGFKQAVLFENSTTLAGPLVIDFNSLDGIPAGGSPVASQGWFFLSKSATLATLTLSGDVQVNNRFSEISQMMPTVLPNFFVGPTVELGGKNSTIAGGTYNLSGIDLGGANRVIDTNMPGDAVNSYFGFFVATPLTDSACTGSSVTKTGTGNLILSAANTFTGDLNITAGTLSLIGNGQLASKNITISGGSDFYISNISRDPTTGVAISLANRLTAVGGVNLVLRGGDVEFAGTSGQTLSFNSIDIQKGLAILHPFSNSGTNATLLTTSLLRAPGSTLLLPSLPTTGGAGTSGAYVKTSTINGVAPIAGVVLPWAITGDAGGGNLSYSGFALYNSTYGFQPSNALTNPNFLAGTAFAGVATTTDFQLTAHHSLLANTEIHSLVMGSGLNLTSAGTPRTLKVNSGGILFSVFGATIGSATAANNVSLDFTGQEAIIAVTNGQANIYGSILNANGLNVNASGGYGYSSVNLIAANPFNSNGSLTAYNWGATYINAGRLVVQNAGALPSTTDVSVNTSTISVNPGYNSVTSSPAVLDLYGNSVAIGALNGDGTVAFAPMFNGPKGNLSGTLTIGNGGNSGSFSGFITDTLLALMPYGANQGNQASSYGSIGNMARLSVVKTGAGTQTFSGNNLYTGSTAINGGTLALSGAGTVGVNSALTLSGVGSTFDVSGGSGSSSVGSLAGGSGTFVNLGSKSLTIGTNGQNTLFSGTITGAGGGIRKTGGGTLTLDGVSNYTGSTDVYAGILTLDHTVKTDPMLSTSSPLIVSGGSLHVRGSSIGAVMETPAGLTVNAGASSVEVTSPSALNTSINLGAITRTAGGTVDFSMGGSSARVTTSSGVGGSILGGFATVNGLSDWAAVSSGRIVAASSVGGVETVSNNVAAWGAGAANVVSGSGGFQGTTSPASAVNSILFRAGSSSQINIADTLTVGSGGVLVSGAVGNHSSAINGGILKSGNGQDLVFIQNNTANALMVGATMFGAGGLTKSGAGTLVISGNDIHFGATNINAGTVVVTGTSTLGSSSALTVRAAGLVDFSQTSSIQTFTSMSIEGGMLLGGGGVSLGADDSSSNVSGFMSGSGAIIKNGNGRLNFSSPVTYTGSLLINSGSVAVNGQGSLGLRSAVTVNSSGSNAAVLDLSGASTAVSLGSLSGGGNLILGPVGMTIGSNNSSTTFGGYITGIGGYIKVGGGTLTLTGSDVSSANTQYRYTVVEGATVNGGTLKLDYRGDSSSKLQYSGGLSVGGGGIMAVGHYTTPVTQNTGYYFYINSGASTVQAATPDGGTANYSLTLPTFNRSAGGTVDFVSTNGSGGGKAYIRASNTSTTNGILGGYATANNMSDWATTETVDSQTKVVTAMANSVAYQVSASSTNNYTATTYSGNQGLYSVSGFTGLEVGQGVIGAGIPVGTTIVEIRASTGYVRMSKAATAAGTSVAFTFNGQTLADVSQVKLGQTINGTNVIAGSTVASITGNIISLSLAPTGPVSSLASVGYALGTSNDRGASIATLDNPANWTTANYGTGLAQANLTDVAGFGGTIAASTTVNSLRVNATAAANIGIASGQSLTIASGGILETASVGANAVNISGGTLRSGNGSDLIFIQNNTAAPLAVSSAIPFEGVTKSGAGAVILTGSNTYGAATTVNAGTLALGGSSKLGNGNSAVTVRDGAILDLQGSTATTQAFGSLSSMSGNKVATGGGTVILGSSISTLTVGGDNTSTQFSGVIQNGTGSTAGLTKVGTGVLSLGGNNTYTGMTNVHAGTLMLTGGGIAGTVAVGNGSAVASLSGSGSVGDVIVNSFSSGKYGVLTAGIPIVGAYTLPSAGAISTRNLTFQGGSAQVNFLLGSDTIAGTTYSVIDVMGDLTFNDAVLNITALEGFGDGTYHLFSYTGLRIGTLNFGSYPAGYDPERLSLRYGNGSVDLIVAVPEPATCGLFFLGAGLVFAAQRRLRGAGARRR